MSGSRNLDPKRNPMLRLLVTHGFAKLMVRSRIGEV
jgi:hypothetical protein